MRERAAQYPHNTAGVRDAIVVFDDWLKNYEEPSEQAIVEVQLRLCVLVCIYNRHFNKFKHITYIIFLIHSYPETNS